jgi:hypothetical protein
LPMMLNKMNVLASTQQDVTETLGQISRKK